MVSLGSGLMMLLAFFIPSIQEQWDRYQSRKVIQEYVSIGDQLFDQNQYALAEQAYAKAFEMSEQKRLDIEMKRLEAKVNKMSVSPDWGGEAPDDMEEVDFEVLLHLQAERNDKAGQVSTLNNYGIYLSAVSKFAEAESVFKKALALDSTDVTAYINYGNLLDQRGDKQAADNLYQKALRYEPDNTQAHYNLGLLYEELGNTEGAIREFEKVLTIDPKDDAAKVQLNELRASSQKK